MINLRRIHSAAEPQPQWKLVLACNSHTPKELQIWNRQNVGVAGRSSPATLGDIGAVLWARFPCRRMSLMVVLRADAVLRCWSSARPFRQQVLVGSTITASVIHQFSSRG